MELVRLNDSQLTSQRLDTFGKMDPARLPGTEITIKSCYRMFSW